MVKKKNNKKQISNICIMFLISILVTTNTAYASVPENNETSKMSVKELTVEKMPEQITDEIDADIADVVEVSTKDAEDLSSITLVNADNTETAYLFSEPVKYIDKEKNEIKFIDNTINDAKGIKDFINKNAYKSSGNTFDTSFSKALSDGIILNQGDYSFEMTPLSSNKSKAVKKNNDLKNNPTKQDIVEYADAFDNGGHLQYEMVNTGLKESILVEKYDGNNVYQFEIKAKGLVPDVSEGIQIEFLDEKTKQSIFTVQPSFLEDSYESESNEKEKHISYDNYYTVKDMGKGNFVLTMVIDQEFMENPDTVYPVVIDPTIMVGTNNEFESSYAFQYGETHSYVNDVLFVGNYATRGEGITYIKPTGMNTKKHINPSNVISATFHIRDDSVWDSPDNCKVNLYDSNTNIKVAKATYSGLVSHIGGLQSSATFTTRYANYTFDITYLAQEWLRDAVDQGGWPQDCGFILRADQGTNAPGRRMDSGSMVLVINYSTDEIIEGIYNIRNVQEGSYLSYNTNNQLTMTTDLKSTVTQWKLIRDRQYGAYTIRPVNNSNVAVNVASSNFADGTSVVTNAAPNPYWRIVRNKNRTYRIVPGRNQAQVSTAIVLNKTKNAVCLQEYTNRIHQDWIFEPVINQSEFYIKSVNNNKNLSLNAQNNTCVETPSQTSDNQRWNFVKQSDGTYMIFNSSGDWATRQSGKTYGKNYIGTETTGNTVKMCSNGGNKWIPVMNNDSTYSFLNVETGKYLALNSNLKDVQALPSEITTYQRWTLEPAKKDICVGGMYMSATGDFSNWADSKNSNVLAACNKIGYRTLTHIKKGNSIEVRDMIRRSSIFVIDTHGNTDENSSYIACNANGNGESDDLTFLTSNLERNDCTSVKDLPDNCFATTRLVFLAACSTAGGKGLNLATALHQKGVQTVIGFNSAIFTGPTEYFVKEFVESLGDGQTLGQAIADADKYALTYPDFFDTMSNNLVIIGNKDLTATFRY